ncbi:MAG: hypothetical protein P1S60_16410 [Anaerolineae bacterium]|nr:hypothetical protein [Anaerolineae bacterium]
MLRLYQTPSYELWWNPEDGTVILESPGRSLSCILGLDVVYNGKLRQVTGAELISGRISQEAINDMHGLGQIVHIYYVETSGLAMTLHIRLYQTRPFALMRISVTNVGQETVSVQQFFIKSLLQGLQHTPGSVGFFTNGQQSDEPSLLFLRSDMSARSVPHKRNAWFSSEMVGAITTASAALIGGGVSTADQLVRFSAGFRSSVGWVMLASEANNYPLDVGAAISSEWFYFEWVPLPASDAFAQYAHAVIRQMDVGPVKEAPSMWGVKGTGSQQVNSSAVTDTIAGATLLSPFIPLTGIEIPAAIQGEIHGNQDVQEGGTYTGPAGIAQRISRSGFLPGLVVTPLLVPEDALLGQKHPEWFVKKRRGITVTIRTHTSSPRYHILDATQPSVIEYLHDYFYYCSQHLGYRSLYLDRMYVAALTGSRYNTRITRAQILRRVIQIARDAVGKDGVIAAGRCPYGPSVGLVDVMQTSALGSPRVQDAPAIRTTKASFHVPRTETALVHALNRAWMNKRLWVNDPGPITISVNNEQSSDLEILKQITIIGLTGERVSLSPPLGKMSEKLRGWLACLFPQFIDGVDTLDLLSYPQPEFAAVNMARSWGKWLLLALFNWSNEYVERDLPQAVIHDKQIEYHLVDFWGQRYLRIKPESEWPVLHLDPYGVILLSIRPVDQMVPHLVATTFHLTQGGEVAEFVVLDDRVQFSLSLGRRASGEVWLALPGRPVGVWADGHEIGTEGIRAVATDVYAVAITVDISAEVSVAWT